MTATNARGERCVSIFRRASFVKYISLESVSDIFKMAAEQFAANRTFAMTASAADWQQAGPPGAARSRSGI
jgi:hypothetical protein